MAVAIHKKKGKTTFYGEAVFLHQSGAPVSRGRQEHGTRELIAREAMNVMGSVRGSIKISNLFSRYA